jgi:hypothetical protein
MSLTDASGDAKKQLGALAANLAGRNFGTLVLPEFHLSVVAPAARGFSETVSAGPADDGAWWFWWSWGVQIALISDVETAAFKIAYVLTPQAEG